MRLFNSPLADTKIASSIIFPVFVLTSLNVLLCKISRLIHLQLYISLTTVADYVIDISGNLYMNLHTVFS